MDKIRYEIDPHNRLVIKESGEKSKLPRFRRVLDGRFKAGRDNILTYHVKSPTPAGVSSPHQVKLRGRWSLTKDHDLRLTLDKWQRQTFGDQLTLQGELISADKNSLLFALTTRAEDGAQSTYILKLEGSWQADKNNRLTFRVKNWQGKEDSLTFDGIWEINKNHQIIYEYEKAKLTTKLKEIRALIFKGYWDIKEKTRISYVMEENTDSVFNFRTGLGIFRDKYIKYELGIGLSGRKEPLKKTIILFGTWKLKKDKGLLFEVEYEAGRLKSITFGADAKLSSHNSVSFKLKNTLNEEIGGEFNLSHRILKGDGEAFLRLLKTRQESAILAGAGWRW